MAFVSVIKKIKNLIQMGFVIIVLWMDALNAAFSVIDVNNASIKKPKSQQTEDVLAQTD